MIKPDVAVTVIVPVPVAVLLAFIVSVSPLTATVIPELELIAVTVTVPVKPPVSVTVIVSVTLPPGGMFTAGEVGVTVKLGFAVTVRAIVVGAVRLPDVPVMVTVELPTVAVLLAVKVITLVEVAGLVLRVAVTPLGRPLAAKVTLPLNGLTSVTAIVSVPVAPCAIDSVAAEGFNEKLPPPPGATPLTEQGVPLSEKAVGTVLVVPFQVPLKPTPAKLPPAAMLPL